MVQVENGLFIIPDREAMGEGVAKRPYPSTNWWMEKVEGALLVHPAITLHIRVPAVGDETWDAAAYVQSLIREWELYRVHFPVPARLSVLWMDAGFALLDSPCRWKELLEVLRRSLSNWSVGLKILEVFPLLTTEDQLFRLWELGFRQLRLNLLEGAGMLEKKSNFDTALHLVQQARKMGYRSVKALWRLDYLGQSTHPKEAMDRLIFLRPDAVEWPDWLDMDESNGPLRKEVRSAFFPLAMKRSRQVVSRFPMTRFTKHLKPVICPLAYRGICPDMHALPWALALMPIVTPGAAWPIPGPTCSHISKRSGKENWR
ncbi:MAG: hypothetical protein IPJ40_10620 [Saprospirales bacterium]|nr:hypothetical protein [Saprospirales bacterium]